MIEPREGAWVAEATGPVDHARVEDRIRSAKDTGLRNLPFHALAQNRIWLAITDLATDLLAFTQLRTQTTTATHPGRRRTPGTHQTTPTPAHRSHLALG